MKWLNKNWWTSDKKFHFIVWLLIMIFSTHIIYFIDNELSLLMCQFCGFFIAVSFGWLKEQVDSMGYGTHDIHDIDADMLGVYLGVIVNYILIGYVYG